MSKISIIGAGNVGATAAKCISHIHSVKEIVLLDIKEGVAEGKAMDIAQSQYPYELPIKIKGVTSDYSATANSDVVVITSGVPRKPGMTREELVEVNAKVVTSVVNSVAPFSPNATYVIVSNPLDTMTYLTVKVLESNVPANRIVGMGGLLDSARFAYYLAEKADCTLDDIENAYVLGGHGDTTMVPLVSVVNIKGKLATDVLSSEDLSDVVEKTMKGGATLTKLIGTSAWVAPAQQISLLVDEILNPTGEFLPCSVYRAEQDACYGSICKFAAGKVAEIIDPVLPENERVALENSIAAVKKVNEALNLG